MNVFDVWANHQDCQAVLRRKSNDNTQEVVFIDHGHMFGGPEWNFKESHGLALHVEMAVYTNLWQDEKIASWISCLQAVALEILISVTHSIPSQWYRGDIAKLIGRLVERLDTLPGLIQEDAAKTWHPSQRKSIDETLRLSDPGIHNLGTPGSRSPVYHSCATARSRFIHPKEFHLATVENEDWSGFQKRD
jgi:hypothetical protein